MNWPWNFTFGAFYNIIFKFLTNIILFLLSLGSVINYVLLIMLLIFFFVGEFVFALLHNFLTFLNKLINFIISFSDGLVEKIIIKILLNIFSKGIRGQYQIYVNLIKTSLSCVTIFGGWLLWMMVIDECNVVLLWSFHKIKIIKFWVIFKSFLNFFLFKLLSEKLIFHKLESLFEEHLLFFFNSFRLFFLDFFFGLKKIIKHLINNI